MDAVLFDMDGVVVDSERYWAPKERESILPEVVPDQDVAVAEITGRPYREIFTYLDDNYEVAVTRERFLELFETTAREIYAEEVALMDGFEELGRDLQAAGVATALVTSSPHDWLNVVLDRFDIHDHFDAVVSADDVSAGKPAPDIYERAASDLSVTPDRAIAVEDSNHGAQSARAAGAYTVGYTGVHDVLAADAADAVADSPSALRAVLFERIEAAE